MKSAVLIWLSAIRPRTLPLACAAIILGCAIATYEGFYNGSILALALATAVLLQIVSNLANDYGDAVSGVDNDERVGPKRVMQTGLVTQKSMQQAIIFAISCAVIVGISLLYVAFAENFLLAVSFIAIGLLAIIAAITYTMGAKPYGYQGYGDVSVFIFFGLVGVIGSYTLFTQSMNMHILLPAISCGLLCTSVLNINNLRDFTTDSEAGKNTLVVKIGIHNAIIYHWLLYIVAELCTVAYIVINDLPALTWLHLIPFILLVHSATKLPQRENSELMNKQLKITVIATFIYCSLFSLGLVL